MAGKIVAVSVSRNKGERKSSVDRVELRQDYGIAGDAHAGGWHRQVSLLSIESIRTMRALGLDVNPGDFAENFTTEGIDLPALPVGTRFKVGRAVLEVTQIGKECHTRCAIYHQAGECVMPKEGIFAKVVTAGTVRPGDIIVVQEPAPRRPAGPVAGQSPLPKRKYRTDPLKRSRYNVISVRVDDDEMENLRNMMETTHKRASELMRDAFALFLERCAMPESAVE